MLTGRIDHEEMVIVTRTGEERTIILNMSSVFAPDGTLVHSISILTDITERKLAEDRIRMQSLILEMMNEGVCVAREEGTPQGGPLSPLLANFLLDDLDKELEKRGHRFCRYADDCNIYVRTMEAGNRVMESITGFLEKKLKLKVNREKSCVAQTMQRKFLGYRIYKKGLLTIAPQSVERLKEKIRNMTPRRIAKPLKEVAQGLGPLLRGWMGYFQLIEGRNKLVELDGWIRRRMRAIRLQQLKRPRTVAQFLQEQGVPPALSWITATSGKGKWRLSKSQGVHRGMRDKWLESLGLESLVKLREELTGNLKETAVYENVRTVV